MRGRRTSLLLPLPGHRADNPSYATGAGADVRDQ